MSSQSPQNSPKILVKICPFQ